MGEATLQLNKQISINRNAKAGWENMIKHFREFCTGPSFSIQVSEMFNGARYSNNKFVLQSGRNHLIGETTGRSL